MSEKAAFSILEKRGISPARLSLTVSEPQIIRNDGYAYLVKTLIGNSLHFTNMLYSSIRSTSGELLVFHHDKFIGSIEFWQLPFKPGKYTLAGRTINLKVGFHSINSTIAMRSDLVSSLAEIRGRLESKLKGEFSTTGDFAYQAVLYLAANLDVIPWSKAERWARYNYIARCPKCQHSLDLKSTRLRIAWDVECSCGCKFVAL